MQRAMPMVATMAAAALVSGVSPARADLVPLRSVDPTIVQDIRYAGPNNFTGRIVPGYEGTECRLEQTVAVALARVQRDLKARGLGLKIYDCYRPTEATAAFIAWSRSSQAPSPLEKSYFPRTTKDRLIVDGYISSNSTHTRGTAVDLTLIRLPHVEPPTPPADRRIAACTAPQAERMQDSSLDFGTGYDCFDDRSRTDHPDLSSDQRRLRRTLVTAMAKHGFANYRREWWHFSYTRR